jgi:hypothetical protein
MFCLCSEYNRETVIDLLKKGKTKEDLKELDVNFNCKVCFHDIEKLIEKYK